MSDLATVEQGAFTVSSNTASAEQISEALQIPDTPPPAEAPPPEETTPDPAVSDAGKTLNVRKRSLEGRKQTIQDEINALVRQREEAKRELERLRQEAQPPAPAPAEPPVLSLSQDPEPQEDGYATYAEFVKATSQWTARQAVREFEAQQQQRLEQQRRAEWSQNRDRSFGERLNEARQRIPDFDVLVNREDIELSSPIVEVIKDSPVAADLMLHLAHYPDDAQRLNALPPMLAFGEMKALEGRLSAARPGSSAGKSISQAKPPIKPVGSQPTGTSDDPSEMDFSPEYVRRMNAMERSRRRF